MSAKQQLEESIELRHEELQSNLRELEGKLRSATDWRRLVRNHPGAMLAAAFGAGAVVGLIVVLRARQGVRGPVYSMPSLASDKDAGRERYRYPANDAWGAVKGTLIGVAANKFKRLFVEAVLGVKDELGNARDSRRHYHAK